MMLEIGRLGGRDATPPRLSRQSVERRADDVLWLRYRVER